MGSIKIVDAVESPSIFNNTPLSQLCYSDQVKWGIDTANQLKVTVEKVKSPEDKELPDSDREEQVKLAHDADSNYRIHFAIMDVHIPTENKEEPDDIFNTTNNSTDMSDNENETESDNEQFGGLDIQQDQQQDK